MSANLWTMVSDVNKDERPLLFRPTVEQVSENLWTVSVADYTITVKTRGQRFYVKDQPWSYDFKVGESHYSILRAIQKIQDEITKYQTFNGGIMDSPEKARSMATGFAVISKACK